MLHLEMKSFRYYCTLVVSFLFARSSFNVFQDKVVGNIEIRGKTKLFPQGTDVNPSCITTLFIIIQPSNTRSAFGNADLNVDLFSHLTRSSSF